jgi:hypothetical protein
MYWFVRELLLIDAYTNCRSRPAIDSTLVCRRRAVAGRADSGVRACTCTTLCTRSIVARMQSLCRQRVFGVHTLALTWTQFYLLRTLGDIACFVAYFVPNRVLCTVATQCPRCPSIGRFLRAYYA